MMHDFMITREHAIFMDLPVVFDLDKAARGEPPIGWDDTYGARVGIVPRMGTDADIRWFEIEPCYVFHPLNAFAEGSRVVCDVGRHATLWRGSMDDFQPSYLHRWTFDLESGAVTRGGARRRVARLPARRRPRCGPAPSLRLGGCAACGPAARRSSTIPAWSSSTTWRPAGPSATTSDRPPIRVSSCSCGDPDAGGEDAGWAMGLVYDETTDRSDLVILDAVRRDG